MSLNNSKKKSGIPLVIAIVLAAIIFIVSLKFHEQTGAKLEFFLYFLFSLSLLSYTIKGKRTKVSLIGWPIIIGIFFAIFNKWYSATVLDRVFSSMALWLNITAILIAGLIYVIKIVSKKNVLWEGKDDGTHEEEVIKMAQERNKEKENEIEELKVKPEKKEIAKKETSKKKVEPVEKVEELDEAPAVVGYEPITKATPAVVPSAEDEGDNEDGAPAVVPSAEDEGDNEDGEESYFNLNNDNDLRRDVFIEKDLSEEVGDILNDFDNDDDFEDKKEDLSEGMSVNFNRAINEDD